MVCKNTRFGEERKRKREDLLSATELKLAPVVDLVAMGKLKGGTRPRFMSSLWTGGQFG